MRKDATLSLVLSLAFLLMAGCRTMSVDASTLKPTHLKGLRAVNLVVYVDRDLEDHASLERELSARARKILADEAISVDGPEGVTLAIDVRTYPAKGLLAEDAVLVGVSVQLSEQVRLVRDPSLRLPGGNGAVTWSRESVNVESKADLRTALANEVDLQVGAFAADVKGANK